MLCCCFDQRVGQAWKQLTRLQRQHSLPFPGPVNTHAPSPDVDPEADQQVPSTPRQQWQRRMLPPLWSVDQRGKPFDKEDLRQHLQLQQDLQQQQQQDLLQQQHHPQQQWLAELQHGVPEHEEDQTPFAAAQTADALAPETPAQGSAAAAAAAASSTSTDASLLNQTAADGSKFSMQLGGGQQQPPVGAAAAPIAIDTAAADKVAAAASAAAAAAQQASVDKLIALLQPPGPLAHTISLQPGQQQQLRVQAAAAAEEIKQQGMQGLYSMQTEGSARPSSQQQAADQQLLHELQQQEQQVHQSKTAPLPRLAVVTPAAAAAAMLGANAPLGLPPRVPLAHNVPGILPPAQLLVPGSGGGSSGFDGRQVSSLSAPNSPSMGPRGGSGGAGSMFAGEYSAAGALQLGETTIFTTGTLVLLIGLGSYHTKSKSLSGCSAG